MHVFKEIDKSSTIVESNIINYTQNLNTSSFGIQPIKIISSSTNDNYWDSLNVMFYTSGSPVYQNELKFTSPSSNLSINQLVGSQHLSKYHGYPSSSLISVPSKYYGEKIKEGSFQLTESDVTDLNGVKPIIKDDGFGNLYSTNAHHSQSVSSPSSSDNYVGNIFYDKGLAVITETGSWSVSVNYSDLGTNFDLKFDSQQTVTTHEYNVTLLPQEYNHTMNHGIRNTLIDSKKQFSLSTPYIASTFTSSDFQPYITTINLYQQGNYDTPVIQATLPKPIRKSDKINLRFKIKLDI